MIKMDTSEVQFLQYSPDLYFQKCKSLNILPLAFRFMLNNLVMFHKLFYNLSPVKLPTLNMNTYTENSLRSSHCDSLSIVLVANIVSNIITRINASSRSQCQKI